jgi:hypothetical protein
MHFFLCPHLYIWAISCKPYWNLKIYNRQLNNMITDLETQNDAWRMNEEIANRSVIYITVKQCTNAALKPVQVSRHQHMYIIHKKLSLEYCCLWGRSMCPSEAHPKRTRLLLIQGYGRVYIPSLITYNLLGIGSKGIDLWEARRIARKIEKKRKDS